MSEKLNATCAICGNKYHMCISCKSIMELNPWKIHTDTAEHYKIYQIIHGYSIGVYSKEETRAKLEMVDLSDADNFIDSIKNAIHDIYTDDVLDNIDVIVEPNIESDKLEEDIERDTQE